MKFSHVETRYKVTLAPGQAHWTQLGSTDLYATGAVVVTAAPHVGHGGDLHVLKVENVNITRVMKDQGGGIPVGYHAGCNVVNNGKTTIEEWSISVGVIYP